MKQSWTKGQRVLAGVILMLVMLCGARLLERVQQARQHAPIAQSR